MTDQQRKRGHDIEVRAQPLFRELAHVEEKIRPLRRQLDDALNERNKIKKQIELISDEKSAWWEEVFATMEA